ncbi:MAG: response regulator [Deltaproteobacteria bacterium]|nr:response regulator [Deltaproteobacteria bacterium]
MKIQCIIVDDEPPAVDELNYILSQIENVEVLATAGSVSEGITAIEKLKPNVVFLDIHMPRHSGFYIAEKVGEA